jgi:hypothetical protein
VRNGKIRILRLPQGCVADLAPRPARHDLGPLAGASSAQIIASASIVQLYNQLNHRIGPFRPSSPETPLATFYGRRLVAP